MNGKKSRLTRMNAFAGATFSLPSIMGMLSFFLIPLAISFVYAFTESGVMAFSLGGFKHVLTSPAFKMAFMNMLKLLATGLGLLMLLSLVSAMFFIYLKRTSAPMVFLFLAIQLLPIAIPSSVIHLFVEKFFSINGVINGIATDAGLDAVNFLDSSLSFFILIGLYLWKNAGLAILIFYARINAIPKEIAEAARSDGAGVIRRTLLITIPLIRSAFQFVMVIGVWGIFNVAKESYMIFGNYPNSAIYGLQNFLNNHFTNANYSVLSAASILFIITIMALILLPFSAYREER